MDELQHISKFDLQQLLRKDRETQNNVKAVAGTDGAKIIDVDYSGTLTTEELALVNNPKEFVLLRSYGNLHHRFRTSDNVAIFSYITSSFNQIIMVFTFTINRTTGEYEHSSDLFYPPTTYGAEGQILKSNGMDTSSEWVDVTNGLTMGVNGLGILTDANGGIEVNNNMLRMKLGTNGQYLVMENSKPTWKTVSPVGQKYRHQTRFGFKDATNNKSIGYIETTMLTDSNTEFASVSDWMVEVKKRSNYGGAQYFWHDMMASGCITCNNSSAKENGNTVPVMTIRSESYQSRLDVFYGYTNTSDSTCGRTYRTFDLHDSSKITITEFYDYVTNF